MGHPQSLGRGRVTHIQAKRMRRGRKRRQRRAARIRIAVLLVLGVIVGSLVVGGLVLNREIHKIARETADLNIATLGQNTTIYDRYGHLLGVVAGQQNRTLVTSKQIPSVLKKATVAIEDKRFYQHHGIDYLRLAGAAYHDIVGGGGLQGASTITMQLMKVLVLGGNDQSLTGKLKEAYLAVQYEKTHSKDQVLTNYLNSVFYGNDAVGVQAASLTYFNRNVEHISLPQAALLAGLPQAPTEYDPFVHAKAALQRRNEVLAQMADQGYISTQLATKAEGAGLELHPGNAYSATPQDGYFFEYVKENLQRTYGQASLADDGLKVYTTIDPTLDHEAQAAIDAHLGSPGDPQAAVVLMDSRTGAIRAMQSTQSYSVGNQFNYVTQALRQPGSTFKAFVLTTAIKHAINPYTTYYDSRPLDFVSPIWGLIKVQTYSNTYPGRISIHDATLQSDNSVYTQMTLDLGPQAIVNTAYSMGIPRSRNLPVYPSVGLGSGVVTPLDMVTAYSALSNQGRKVTPLSVTRIVPPTGTAVVTKPGLQRVLTDGVAYEVTKILHDNVTSGTGTAADIAPDIAGKTGTTSNYVDAWFVGYTPCYTAAVWVGYPNASGTPQTMTDVGGIQVTGGTYPAEIWATFMREVLSNPEYQCPLSAFPLPSDPVVWKPFSSAFTTYAPPPKKKTTTTTNTTTNTTTTTTAPGKKTHTTPPPPPPPPPHTTTTTPTTTTSPKTTTSTTPTTPPHG
jgi:penicillin-binding protein 1A